MSKLRRYQTSDATFFITCVTFERKQVLQNHASLFEEVLERQCAKAEAELHAWVILPDHWHAVISLGGSSLPKLLKNIKLSLANKLKVAGAFAGGRFWQLRYWDHVIRDQRDYNTHIDYVHYNPVKHELVNSPFDYEFSTAKNYLHNGVYQEDWGVDLEFVGDFGE